MQCCMCCLIFTPYITLSVYCNCLSNEIYVAPLRLLVVCPVKAAFEASDASRRASALSLVLNSLLSKGVCRFLKELVLLLKGSRS